MQIGSAMFKCEACLAGKVQELFYHTDPCKTCDAGTYSSSSGAFTCTACVAGTSSAEGASTCTAFSAGTSSAAGGLCTDCDAGTYAGSGKASPCTPCPARSNSPASSTAAESCACNDAKDSSSEEKLSSTLGTGSGTLDKINSEVQKQGLEKSTGLDVVAANKSDNTGVIVGTSSNSLMCVAPM